MRRMRIRQGAIVALAALGMLVSTASVTATASPTATSSQDGQVFIVETDARSAHGNLRVGVRATAVGTRARLVVPEDRTTHPNTRRLQHWRFERMHIAGLTNARQPFRLRNVYTDKCLTVARPEHSPVYLQYCGQILGQGWDTFPMFGPANPMQSANYNHTVIFSVPPKMCLDITEFRNLPLTALQVGRCHGKWNQQWRAKPVPAHLR